MIPKNLLQGSKLQSTFILLILAIYCSKSDSEPNPNIEHLNGEAGFRSASIHWKYPISDSNNNNSKKPPVSFRVRYCELHVFGVHRCRYQVVDSNLSARSGRFHDGEIDTESNELYQVEIGGLRMATNYTFQVVPQDPVLKNGGKPSHISLQTKGFSAKATKCLADSSEVMVETGPFFGGRISVEDSPSPACYVKGSSQSSQTKYSLRIKHRECGSVINGSKVTTVILVQENVPILTHSTRRFVVVCSFSPESFVVKSAGVNLPRDTSVAKGLDFHRLLKVGQKNGQNRIGRAGDTALYPGGNGNGNDELGPGIIIRAPPPPSGSLTRSLSPPDSEAENEVVDDDHRSPSLLISSHQAHHSLPAGRDFSQIASSGRALDDGGGYLETALVFGMISIAIVASMASVIWFVKSYRTSGDLTQAYSDTDSTYDGDNSSISSISGRTSSIRQNTNTNNTNNNGQLSSITGQFDDTRSEVDVELDFEFSEETNYSFSSN